MTVFVSPAASPPRIGPVTLARATIAQKSKSFALASRILDRKTRDRTAIVYTYCRHADDAVDELPHGDLAGGLAALERLRHELDLVYTDRARQPVLLAFAAIAHDHRIPRRYPEELITGMAMDVGQTRYVRLADLHTYCFRVAGVVGLMMCHVFGLADDAALVPAARLGTAMQLTNICRDVAEDWQRGRLYIPDDLLAACGAQGLAGDLGGPLPRSAHAPLAEAVRELLALADRHYRAADAGIPALPRRAGFAVRAARSIYAAIGDQLRARDCDVTAGRAIVPARTKLRLVGQAALATLLARRPLAAHHVPTRILEVADVPIA